MSEEQGVEQFNKEEAYSIVKEVVERHVNAVTYDDRKVGQWIQNIEEDIVKRLTSLGHPFKYIVTCLVMQRTGAGVHVASSCFWDANTDDSVTVPLENDNKSLCCITSVYGVAL